MDVKMVKLSDTGSGVSWSG